MQKVSSMVQQMQMNNPLAGQAPQPLSLLHKRVKSLESSQSTLPQPLKQTGQIFSQNSQDFQKYSSLLQTIEQRISNRQSQHDDHTQLAIKAADSDSLQALEAAQYFMELAIQQQNQTKTNNTVINNLNHQITKLKQTSKTATNQLENFNIEFNQDKDMILAQINKIKSTVTECQLLAAELGFPLPQEPEILSFFTPSCFDGNRIIINGQEKSNQQISLQLLLAEQAVMRNYTFLLKQMVSDFQKQKAQQIEQLEAAQADEPGVTCQGDTEVSGMSQNAHNSQQVIKIASELTSEQQAKYNNPVAILQEEFKGSGAAVARELLSLRNKTAGMLLREQEFDADTLLSRDGCDDQTLRALVCGLQNEIYMLREQIKIMQDLGLGVPDRPQPLIVFTGEQVHRLAEQALQSRVDVDLLPQSLARKVDFLVEETLAQADGVAEAQLQVKNAQMPVDQLQLLIERRNAAMQQMNEVAGELVQFLKTSVKVPDIEAELSRFLQERQLRGTLDTVLEQAVRDQGRCEVGESGIVCPVEMSEVASMGTGPLEVVDGTFAGQASSASINALAFAQLAFEQSLDSSRRFDELLGDIRGYMELVQQNMDRGFFEKYDSDGSGFLEALQKLDYLIAHCRALHQQIAQRDFCIVKLQEVVKCLQKEKQVVETQVSKVAAVRNGLLKAYFDLQAQNQLQIQANQTLRLNGQNQVQIALDHAATTRDRSLAESLQNEASSYSGAVRTLAWIIRDEVLATGGAVGNLLDEATAAVRHYRDVVLSKAQKASQTTRLRKAYDTAVQVEEIAGDPGKGGKPAKK